MSATNRQPLCRPLISGPPPFLGYGVMSEPDSSRPYMPGYGTLPEGEGTGLLPWSWAVERLERTHDFWLATVWPDGRPHVMPVWGVWLEDAVWFSSSLGSRKARNLAGDDRCVL